MKKGDPILIWGGAGGLGSMAIQIARAAGAVPIAIVSGDDKFDYCMELGAKGCINRKNFDHWGMLPHWKDSVGYANWLKGVRAFGSAIWEQLGEKRAPTIVFEHPGEATIPTSMFVCETGGMVVICAGTTGYNATVDLRYLWMRQKRVQGSHFANDDQSYAMNDLAVKGLLNPCLSKAFPYDDVPTVHQLMHDNLHPHGNMAVLVGAPDFGQGKSAEHPAEPSEVQLPAGDVHDTPHPYPLSVPLPDMAVETEEFSFIDDGTKVRDRMHAGIISCRKTDNLHDAARKMIDNEVHALVVIEDEEAVGVLSQTDIVLARQGRTVAEVRNFTVGDWMSQGCASIDIEAPMSTAISTLLKLRIHRLVVSEQGRPVGVLSMTDVVRKAIAAD